jgi:hypothetical protein
VVGVCLPLAPPTNGTRPPAPRPRRGCFVDAAHPCPVVPSHAAQDRRPVSLRGRAPSCRSGPGDARSPLTPDH